MPTLPGSRVTIIAFYDVGWRPSHGENGGVSNKKKKKKIFSRQDWPVSRTLQAGFKFIKSNIKIAGAGETGSMYVQS